MKMEVEGSCQIERDSIYGAVIAMPQIARSAGWPWTLTGLAIRSYFFLVLNICLQAFLLAMIGEEQIFMYPFAGQMHLCDFGANIDQCPDGPNCKGPLGTTFSYPRLYGYDVWSTRIFVRDALKAVFPDRGDEIDAKVDPGEYGLENYWIRVACIFLFMIGVVSDLRKSINLMVLLWTVPTQAESWLRYEVPDWAEQKAEAKDMAGWSELDLVKFQIAGMPLGWKLLNAALVLVPKVVLWLALVPSGVHYLMETAGIVDVLVNAMALTFVLDIDELLFAQLTTVATRHVMENMEELPLFDISMEEDEEDEEVLERYKKEELAGSEWGKLRVILPKRLVTVLFLQMIFMMIYYVRNCEMREDGSWVSKAMHLPQDLSFQPLQLMFGIEPKSVDIPFWTMPGE